MKASLNEIENLVYKAMESMDIPDGVCVSVAESVACLESMGLGGLTDLLVYLTSIDTPTRSPELVQVNESMYAMRMARGQCIQNIESCAMMIACKLSKEPEATIVLEDSIAACFLMPHLTGMTKAPLLLEWPGGSQEQTILACLSPGSMLPEMAIFSATCAGAKVRRLDRTMDELLEEWPRPDVVIAPSDFQRVRNDSIINGCIVSEDAFHALCQLAKRVLVPSSEESRADAGEAQNLIDMEDISISHTP